MNPPSPTKLPHLPGLLLAVFGTMFLVARPLANQFAPYTPLNAYAGFYSILFIAAAGIFALRMPSTSLFSRSTLLLIAAWLLVFFVGALRSPYKGGAIPLATDAALYALIFVAGCIAGRIEPGVRAIFVRVLIALAVLQALTAIWQIHVDLPRLRSQIESGELPLIDSLKSKIGQDRLYGDNAFGTFGNPNSLAAFLVIGFFLLLGHAAASAKNYLLPAHAAFGALMLMALYYTGSKGGALALLAGLWFFILQRLDIGRPRTLLFRFTAIGIACALVILALGFMEIIPSRIFGLSIQVRFEYWRAALSMFAQHPLAGVGLNGYGEWYSHFKTPMGWESRDPHNDYIGLLAELGILAPLIYLALWHTILRGNSPSREVTTSEFSNDKRGETTVIICGTLALLLAIMNFDIFNSVDVINVISGNDRSSAALLGTIQTLALPAIFAAVVLILRKKFSTSPLPDESKTNALNHGFRAAAGAILIHQIVDFDFKSQAVMCGLFLLSGVFHTPATIQARIEPRRWLGWTLIAFAVLLIPTALYIPLTSGLAREQAESAETQFKLLSTNHKLSPGETLAQYRDEIVHSRRRAADTAPFDSETHLDLALALAKFDTRSAANSLSDEILSHLKVAQALRPQAVNPTAMIGSLYFKRGLNEQKTGRAQAARDNFELARISYAEAAARYPLHPGLAIMEGDALMMLNENDKAEARYIDAFRINQKINDPNVYLAAIFSDPRPGAFARHGADRLLLTELDKRAPTAAFSSEKNGMLLRRMMAQTFLLRDKEAKATFGELNVTINEMKIGILRNLERLSAGMTELNDRAHAAFLLAVCHQDFGISSEPDLSAAIKKAIDLQAESVSKKTPGTSPYLFNAYLKPKKN